MIGWFRQLGQASRNLGRTARQNPVWAVQGLVFAPFRFARHLFGVLVLTIVVATVLILVSDGLVWYFALARYPALHTVILLLVWLPFCSCRCARSSRGRFRLGAKKPSNDIGVIVQCLTRLVPN